MVQIRFPDLSSRLLIWAFREFIHVVRLRSFDFSLQLSACHPCRQILVPLADVFRRGPIPRFRLN